MPSFEDRAGIWMIYDYDATAYALAVYNDPVSAARAASQLGYGHVGFWPFGVPLLEAIAWWKEEKPKSEDAGLVGPDLTEDRPPNWLRLQRVIQGALRNDYGMASYEAHHLSNILADAVTAARVV